MTHDPNRLAGLGVFNGDDDVVLPGFAAEEVDGVEFFVGFGVEGADEHVGAVVEADDGLAPVVAEVEAVDVVAAEDDGLAVHGGAFALFAFGEADHEFFQVYGAIAGLGGTVLHAFFPFGLGHGKGGETKYDGDYGIQEFHRSFF